MTRIQTLTVLLAVTALVGVAACQSQQSVVSASATSKPGTGPGPAASTGDGTPEKPVTIPMAADAFKLDGDDADWAKIPAIPAPFAKKAAGCLKLAWREDGLYGLATIPDKDVKIDDANPWAGDCIEIFIEKDNAKSGEETNNSAQYAVAPDPAKDSGPCIIRVPWGGTKDGETAIKAFWKKGKESYTLEFMFPKDMMTPAKLEAGTKLGFNYAIDDDGTAIEQFFSDKNNNAGYHNPSTWGTIILGK
jgi:hypothetical protein